MSKIMETVKSTVAENLGVSGSHTLVDKEHQFSIEEVPDLSGKVAVVTGGSEGIGYGVTHTFLSRNIQHIYILSLSQEVVDKSLDALREELGDEVAKKVTCGSRYLSFSRFRLVRIDTTTRDLLRHGQLASGNGGCQPNCKRRFAHRYPRQQRCKGHYDIPGNRLWY